MYRRRAFTLVEVLVAIAIIAILSAILFPTFAQAKSAAKKSACLNNHRQVALALAMYLSDHAGYPTCGPETGSGQVRWVDALFPYARSTGIFRDLASSPARANLPLAPPYQRHPRYGGYGYNYQYLGNSRPGTPDSPNLPFAASESAIEFPSQTLAMTDCWGAWLVWHPDRERRVARWLHVVDPPLGSIRGSGLGRYYFGDGWEHRARMQARHTTMVAASFCDGHAKALRPRQLDDSNGDGRVDNGYWNGKFDAAKRH
jgi:prepilin-type N-terminal cleavage/methylation domain-containing protein